uniref:Uncharacterized protein n=1 Tax=Amphimedon queenslandica TaxID=400682 RepID=A0A1X7UP46_AMPQE
MAKSLSAVSMSLHIDSDIISGTVYNVVSMDEATLVEEDWTITGLGYSSTQ